MIQDINLKECLIVPADLVAECDRIARARDGDDVDNVYSICLAAGKEMEDAGLTPLYLCSPDRENMYITSYEKVRGEFH